MTKETVTSPPETPMAQEPTSPEPMDPPPKRLYPGNYYPAWMYHAKFGKRLFQNDAELRAAGKGWKDNPAEVNA